MGAPVSKGGQAAGCGAECSCMHAVAGQRTSVPASRMLLRQPALLGSRGSMNMQREPLDAHQARQLHPVKLRQQLLVGAAGAEHALQLLVPAEQRT